MALGVILLRLYIDYDLFVAILYHCLYFVGSDILIFLGGSFFTAGELLGVLLLRTAGEPRPIAISTAIIRDNFFMVSSPYMLLYMFPWFPHLHCLGLRPLTAEPAVKVSLLTQRGRASLRAEV